MIRAIIVENERVSAETLERHLKSLATDVRILDICSDVDSGISSINRNAPDLVFLDVELNNHETGFDILQKVERITFEVIVTTAYDKYAINAAKASAIDFLLKPLLKEDVEGAINKFNDKVSKRTDPRQVELLLSIYQNTMLSVKKVALPTMTGLIFVETASILYFEGAGNQTMVYFTDGKKECISSLIKECEKMLYHSNFCRIHKSYLINLIHIKKYLKGKDGSVILTDGTTLTVSRELKDEFLKRVAN